MLLRDATAVFLGILRPMSLEPPSPERCFPEYSHNSHTVHDMNPARPSMNLGIMVVLYTLGDAGFIA